MYSGFPVSCLLVSFLDAFRRKKSNGIVSVERARREIGLPRSIHRFEILLGEKNRQAEKCEAKNHSSTCCNQSRRDKMDFRNPAIAMF